MKKLPSWAIWVCSLLLLIGILVAINAYKQKVDNEFTDTPESANNSVEAPVPVPAPTSAVQDASAPGHTLAPTKSDKPDTAVTTESSSKKTDPLFDSLQGMPDKAFKNFVDEHPEYRGMIDYTMLSDGKMKRMIKIPDEPESR